MVCQILSPTHCYPVAVFASKSAAGQASSYALAIWTRLTRFLDYPELELSNNLAENSMRPIALGRSNWIHIGSEQAGPRIAAIFSVVESCRRLNIPIRDYLADILPGLANAPLQRITELTPAAWAARHPTSALINRGFALTDTNVQFLPLAERIAEHTNTP